MPKFSRKTAHVATRKPFGIYDGPVPEPGNYPGVIRAVSLRTFKTGTQAFNVLVELEAPADSPKSQYNGFPAWTKIFLGEHDAQIERENAFYTAVCGKQDVDVVFDDDSDKNDPPVTRIGGVSPVGKKVRVGLQLGDEYKGKRDIEGDAVYPDLNSVSSNAGGGDPDADIAPPASAPSGESEAGAEAEVEIQGAPVEEPESVDHHSLNLPALRKYAESQGIQAKGVSKKDLLAALDAQAGDGGADEAEGGLTEFEPKTVADLEKMDLQAIHTWADPKFEAGDLEGMEKKDLIDLLLEDEFVQPF